MTPRRVKRRSVTSRGTLPPPHQAPPPYLRRQSSSHNSSRRHKNPVSRLIQQQYSSKLLKLIFCSFLICISKLIPQVSN